MRSDHSSPTQPTAGRTNLEHGKRVQGLIQSQGASLHEVRLHLGAGQDVFRGAEAAAGVHLEHLKLDPAVAKLSRREHDGARNRPASSRVAFHRMSRNVKLTQISPDRNRSACEHGAIQMPATLSDRHVVFKKKSSTQFDSAGGTASRTGEVTLK